MKQKFFVVDFGMGNLHSVQKKLARIGANVEISSNPDSIGKADKLILPGVGHFQKAMENLKALNLIDPLNEGVLFKKKPILGICLGMQLMAKKSEEGNAEGFGWFDAEVVRLSVSDPQNFKVPHMGWNQVGVKKESPLMAGITVQSEFYFVHSYHFQCNEKADILNVTVYDHPFVSAVSKENIFGVQYHPEKGHNAGEILLRNFVNL